MTYELITDSCANLTEEQIETLDLHIVSMLFTIGGEECVSYTKGQHTDLKQFYDRMRQKEKVTTSQINGETFLELMEPMLQAGQDVLYIAFSSALSGTCQAANIAADTLREKYPQRKIVVVDSLAASMGEGLLVYYAAKMRLEGKSIDEVADWVSSNRLRLCHWFTVDDLFFLHRGGRVSSASAVLGTVLGVKPVLHVDDEGRLILVGKTRGRKKSLDELVARMEQTIENPQEQVIFISHGDAPEDAAYVERLVREKFSVKDVVLNYIDPVIGGHSGPGTVALFFLGSKR